MSSESECCSSYGEESGGNMGKCMSCCSGKSEEVSNKYPWEQALMDNTIISSDKVSHAAIVSFSDGEMRAAGPKGFKPNSRGVSDILKALKGDTKEIAESGIVYGSGLPNQTPGKLDEGRAIYSTDGKGGGSVVFKTKECVLIVIYNSDPAPATRLASEVAEHMEEEGH